MAFVKEMLRNLLEQQKLFSQQIADQNQKISMVIEQMKEIEKQRGSLDDSVLNFIMVDCGETGGSDRAGSEESNQEGILCISIQK